MAQSHFIGCLLGTAVGDALGLPYEGLSRQRAARLLGRPERHRLLFRRGMVSDDTEHACMVAQSLIASGGDLDAFSRSLAWRLRLWLLCLPAGTGMATLRSVVRLWLGFPPSRSGVFSAGNGPAMRAPLLGAAFDDLDVLRAWNRASSRITHTDPKAEFGAFAVALATQMSRQHADISAEHFLDQLRSALGGEAEQLIALIEDAATFARDGRSTESFAQSLGLSDGVSGYVYHSVPVAIHAWLLHGSDYRSAVTAVIRCGGDTDSTAAIVGGIVGTAVGADGIPEEWLHGLYEWPRSVSWMTRLAIELDAALESGRKRRPPSLPVWGLLPRNLFFLLIVLYHGFRRLLPPY